MTNLEIAFAVFADTDLNNDLISRISEAGIKMQTLHTLSFSSVAASFRVSFSFDSHSCFSAQ